MTFAVNLGGFFGAPQAGVQVRTSWGEVPTGRYYVTVGGERIDQVAQTVYGVQVGAVEALLVVNPGLADLPMELPASLAIVLPDLNVEEPTATSREVALWG